MPYILEIVNYQIKENISTEDFIKKSNKVNTELETMNGFIDREVALSENGFWIEICKWQTMNDAKLAQNNVLKNKVCLNFFSNVKQETIKINYYRVIPK